MRWENLTVPDFERAVRECDGVAIIPVGVIEPHGAHLPLGQDMLCSHWVACRAAEREPAMVLPPYPWGINHEAYHLPGAVVLRRELVLAVLENVCDEIGRNGLTRIILLQGHGGNRYVLPLFVQTMTERERPYSAYYLSPPGGAPPGVLETDETGHACEWETSMALHMYPELVKMEDVPAEPFHNLGRNEPLKSRGVYSPVDWYAQYPTMYVGDASKATPQKGEAILDRRVERVAEAIRAVKEDRVTGALLDEFLEARGNPKSAY